MSESTEVQLSPQKPQLKLRSVDLGEAFTYTGSGGRDLKGTRQNPKNLRTAPQTFDQSFENNYNAALKVGPLFQHKYTAVLHFHAVACTVLPSAWLTCRDRQRPGSPFGSSVVSSSILLTPHLRDTDTMDYMLSRRRGWPKD
jgi:hypothetical protein